ncbi:glycosyltransferase family 2 protein [Candidatus Berkelbacteria bacterium]|nr:glycosyltransferase family 2 protein [Candidatus Berkelbacteria bacterium]
MSSGSDHPRWLEFVPGFLTWGTFLSITILSFTAPIVVATGLIVYALFWMTRAMLMSARLIIGYIRYRRDVKKDWLKQLKLDFTADSWRSIYHLVVVAVSKEDPTIIRATLQEIEDSEYDRKKIIVVVATEARFKENGRKVSRLVQKEFGSKFFHLETTVHPMDLPGEVKGKGGNITWAARHIKPFIERKKINLRDVICTTLDADNRVHRKYFANLTYEYIRHPEPTYATFQPIPMFFNNIWDVPMPIRSIALGSSFWQIIESTRPHRLRNFSAHAQGFEALVKTDFWSTKTIVEDGHQFWRSYFRFNGKHDVVPLNVPIYQDAVLSPDGYWATFKEQYVQKRRWAWGASDIPFVLYHMWRNRRLPFWDKWLQAFRLMEGHFSWATTSTILAVFAWLPRIANPDFQDVVLAHTFPPLYGKILTFALGGLAITLTISHLLLPPVPKKRLGRSRLSVILEWVSAPILLPISNVIFSSLPAIDAQTRLMFGKYLGFRPTEKHVYRQDIKNHPGAN